MILQIYLVNYSDCFNVSKSQMVDKVLVSVLIDVSTSSQLSQVCVFFFFNSFRSLLWSFNGQILVL